MRNRLLCFLVVSLALPSGMFGDFRYTETTRISGGSLVGMMKLAGTFSKQARQISDPITSSVYVKGNRMARLSPNDSEIIDLDKEMITHIDHKKKEYYNITFQEMKEQIEESQREAAKRPHEKPTPKPDTTNTTDMKFNVAVRNTGAKKEYSGLGTSESILTLTVQAMDQKTGQTGNLAMTSDLWLTPEIPGYKEVREFNVRFAQKLGDVYGTALAPIMESVQSQMKAGSTEGLGEMAKEVSKLKGIPIYTVMRMGSTLDGQPLPAASEAPLPVDQNAEMPSKGELAKQGASNAATSAIASKLGGFGGMVGGFGRRKREEPPAPSPSNDRNAGPQATSLVLMETTSEMGGFSSASLDGAQFLPPAGYKQIPAPVRHH